LFDFEVSPINTPKSKSCPFKSQRVKTFHQGEVFPKQSALRALWSKRTFLT